MNLGLAPLTHSLLATVFKLVTLRLALETSSNLADTISPGCSCQTLLSWSWDLWLWHWGAPWYKCYNTDCVMTSTLAWTLFYCHWTWSTTDHRLATNQSKLGREMRNMFTCKNVTWTKWFDFALTSCYQLFYVLCFLIFFNFIFSWSKKPCI